MSKQEKLLKRLQSKPKDFTYDEAKRILNHFGFIELNKGKTSGSRVQFRNGKVFIELHKPHNTGNVMKPYQIKDIIDGINLIINRRDENG